MKRNRNGHPSPSIAEAGARVYSSLVLAVLMMQAAMIPNGSFEEVQNERPAGWRIQTWSGQGQYEHATIARTGNRSVLVSSETGVDGGWQISLAVKPFSKYRLSAWIKTEGVEPANRGLGALINLHSRPERTAAVVGTKDWTEVTLEIDTGADDSLSVNCLLGYYGTARGRAWFDDLSLQLLETRDMKPQATIDASLKFEPISKYIYSQFIEHLGRCIYGGIWAEMLEDRKFYHPVGARQSPWKGTATMSREKPFVGDHSPVVAGTLSQGGLWLEKSREYVGRIWLAGDGKEASVAVRLGNASITAKAPKEGWAKTEFRLKPGVDTQSGELKIECAGRFRVGTVSLMPADNVRGMRRDTLALLKELDAPLYRWPGGNFVSGYEWRDGLGDPDRRPPRRNPAWQGVEHNDFGTHEFLDFCRELGTEPLIVVNTGFGDAYSAAQWVEYVNGEAASDQGKKRAANGRRQPWGVKWWGIGNEMFGNWQLGYMALNQYTTKHNEVYARMKAVDPTILTIGVGEIGGDWSKGMLTHSASQMDLISEHFYCQERPGVMAHVAQIPNAIRAKVAAHREYRKTLPSLKGKDIRIAMDEWNYWYGPHVFGELGTRYFQKDGLGIAAGLHEFFRSTDMVAMAQYAQTVNVIGCIKTTPTAAAFETTGLVLKLYRKQFGAIPVAVSGTPEPLDVMAALTADGKSLTIGVVNPTANSVTLPLTWKGTSVADEGTAHEIASDDPMVYNDPGSPPKVEIKSRQVRGLRTSLEVKPYSATVIVVPLTS
ncbi:MAG TPA: alpha-L-arabinofuranosidase C-terminal domain-containing protein [Fimbriimonadaceae bacterium]|nr:alpha-L-arabinofuranosidase C-terminal domain-containing protein [Fimbriimonadaceae bacterium]